MSPAAATVTVSAPALGLSGIVTATKARMIRILRSTASQRVNHHINWNEEASQPSLGVLLSTT